MKNIFKDRTGEIHITNEGYEVEIIEYYGNNSCTIKFKNGVVIKDKSYHSVRKGRIKNPYHPSVYGVGYFGQGKYKAVIAYKSTKYYITWIDMIKRCYSEKSQQNNPTYKDCTVDERWHNFQVFAEWFENNFNPEYMDRWCLDKDILQKGNKVYSPETCVFIPHIINNVIKEGGNKGVYKSTRSSYKCQLTIKGKTRFLGSYKNKKEAYEVYKEAKKKYIKQIADEWRDKIGKNIYEVLYKWEIK